MKCYPIGVHPVQLQNQAADSQLSKLPFDLETVRPYKRIISVDRIDYSKGLLEKIGSLQSLLEDQPEFKHQFQQLQIACPCRLSAVQELNTQHGTADWQPFDCSYD